MKGRLEEQLLIEKKMEAKISSEMPVLWPFYYSTDYMTAASRQTLMNSVIRFCKYCQENFGMACDKESDFAQITADNLNQYIYTISRKPNGEGMIASGTICLYTSHITTFFNYLENKEVIAKNPTRTMAKRPKIPKKEKIVFLEPEEIQQMYYNIDHCLGDFSSLGSRQKWRSRCNGVSAAVASSLLGHTEEVNEQYYTYDISSMDEKLKIVEHVNKEMLAM